MPSGRQSALHIYLSLPDHRYLMQQIKGANPWMARRAHILLCRADGMSITDIARLSGMSRLHIYKWLKRWQAQGRAGLADKPGRGKWPRQPKETPPQKEQHA